MEFGEGSEMPFGWSDHAVERARQRGIPDDVAHLAMMEGDRLPHHQDRFLLTEDMFPEIEACGLYPKELLKKARKVVPIVVVFQDDTIITAFRPTERIDKKQRGRNTRHKKRGKDVEF